MIGVDEAGKGAVLGSMFVVAVENPGIDELKDSKKLNPDKRQKLAREIKEKTNFSVVEITAEEINKSLREKTMNDIVINGHARALRKLTLNSNNLKSDKVILDAASPSEDYFSKRVRIELININTQNVEIKSAKESERKLKERMDISVRSEHKADEIYNSVRAASILAKVERDSHIECLEEKKGKSIGTGYPSDPNTKEFLKDYIISEGKLPEKARDFWSTSKDILEEKEQSNIEDFI